jgi:hypothetical protein
MKWNRIGSQIINGCQVGWQRRGDEFQSYIIYPDGGSQFTTSFSMQDAQRAYVQFIDLAKEYHVNV